MNLRRPKKTDLVNKVSFGSWITIPHPSVAELLARAGFDWLAIDLEHSAISIESAAELIRVADLSGVRVFVRVGSHDANVIKRVMDAGAHGIIASTVNTADQAKAIVDAVKYPPIGTRGVGLSRAQGYSEEFETHYRWLNKESVVIVQIEHVLAVKNLEAILDTPGVDGFFIGPYDLSASLGIPGKFEHPKMKQAMKRIQEVNKSRNTIAGIHVVHPDTRAAQKRIKEGYKLIGFGIDYLFLLDHARKNLDSLRKSSR
ncbi:MAG: aldolase/citrate lyase family protein [Chthoniobacterales bacterium]